MALISYPKIFIGLLAISCLLLATYPAQAALVPCTGVGGNPCTLCSLFQLLGNINMFIVRDLLAPVAGLLILIGGIMMIASAGSEERYKKGKQILVNTLIGVFIVLAAWAIINTLILTIGQSFQGYQPSTWWQGLRCQ